MSEEKTDVPNSMIEIPCQGLYSILGLPRCQCEMSDDHAKWRDDSDEDQRRQLLKSMSIVYFFQQKQLYHVY